MREIQFLKSVYGCLDEADFSRSAATPPKDWKVGSDKSISRDLVGIEIFMAFITDSKDGAVSHELSRRI